MRHALRILPLVLVGAFVHSTALFAQESTTRGFNVGLHVGGASIQVEDGDRHGAGGGGLILGYGFNRSFQLLLQFDGAELDVDDPSVEGKWTMGHGDLGVRYHFANSLRSWVPYVQAGLTARVVSVEDFGGTPDDDASLSGGALTLGGGILFYFNETLAADIQVAWSGGTFTEVRVNDTTQGGLEIDANSARFDIGVSWWP